MTSVEQGAKGVSDEFSLSSFTTWHGKPVEGNLVCYPVYFFALRVDEAGKQAMLIQLNARFQIGDEHCILRAYALDGGTQWMTISALTSKPQSHRDLAG